MSEPFAGGTEEKTGRYLVTSALPYANGPLHVGQIVGAYLPADIFVRYLRMRGEDVVYICGTDEHGVPITLTAEREGKSAQEVVDYWYAHMKETFERFGISFDNFSRTSRPVHAENTQAFYRKLKAGGYISEAASKQMYSPTEDRFLPDRYVEGTCPFCGYREARGDQCDNCGNWYEAYELIEPHSKVTGGAVEVRETTHLYLDLSQFSERLKSWISSQEHWRSAVKNFILGTINSGLEKRPITRDISWGVPVPEPGFEEKRFYVWFDAPIGYVSSTMEWAERIGEPDRWREYWQEPDTKMIHFIGKDNTVFHTIIWPAMLMGVAEGSDEPYILPYDVPANEFMNLEVAVGDERRAMQMSTSRNLAVWLHEALERFPADPLRFYLASTLPETGDVNFSWREFQARVNGDLIGNLGNYANRVLSFTNKYFGGELRRPDDLPKEARAVLADFAEIEAAYDRKMLDERPREALAELLALGKRANRYFDAAAPWKSRKEDPARTEADLYVCCALLGSIGYHASPYVPEAMEDLAKFFDGPLAPTSGLPLPDAYRTNGAKPLFARIEDAEVEAADRQLTEAVTG
ncbi:metG: methionine--tRNA ligase [Rubrobacter radiotolerans]|uniref:Methionine--tRNA ligase n=1 Tax=Rubrobacter radiotolerans TaxID=42256 RepID=A0A023WZM1_RUBRA|nr:methionine--tRNA ligase [Rubrobacter radiotolerans]AHY45662.1 metG: methionine--tRNA ligase [Rubrobacter radiotolerans]MDX5893076.1 methionine--tRNA ligase [Rubrobacter radiotolerans]SMC03012.1 methionyl-tRNA synthetase [Rubrobacter radiotolerans DSM 5868]